MGVMVRDVITIKPGDGMTGAIKLLVEHDVSALPVVDDRSSAGRHARADRADPVLHPRAVMTMPVGAAHYSRTITFRSDECTFSLPLYSMRPSLRNLFRK